MVGTALIANSDRNFSSPSRAASSRNRGWRNYSSRDLLVVTAQVCLASMRNGQHLKNMLYLQVLLDWLSRGFLTISQIDCLVFDHNGDSESDCLDLRVMSEFYQPASLSDTSRVMSLVYPPRLLDSFLRGLRAATDASFCVHCGPQDLAWFYKPDPPSRVTLVFRQLQYHDQNSSLLSEPLAAAKDL
jgi:hypothetical protein